MRPDIEAILRRMHDALDLTRNDQVTLATEDVRRLARWVRSGPMREINAYALALDRAVAMIRSQIPSKVERENRMMPCCAAECGKLADAIEAERRTWHRSKAHPLRELQLKEDLERHQRTTAKTGRRR